MPDLKLVDAVATLLCQAAACEIDFMFFVGAEMERRGYKIECHQHEVFGTELKITKKEDL